ncbi:hypothetical protein [Pelagicoccus sp. SDUM812002]|uniref:hypothetical protein n=1 Tax=Pelagicoccus sp. SDUM812002 TaxID=3041266 RepID=UPI00280F5BA3|nr:hypothetical protein [Pelagicoccus sp. SDUM812002]MDQ8184327.1 hypothetical protein [Pelagicoccus sp. SDUM812002]
MKSIRLLCLIFLVAAQASSANPDTAKAEKTKKPRQTIAHSIVSPEYQRQRLPNGQWEEQTYALAIGKMLDPTDRDQSLEALSVSEMAEILANALHRQNFIPESNPDNTDLMIVVNWGKTIPYHDGFKQTALDGITNSFNEINAIEIEPESAGSVTLGSSESVSELEMTLAIQSMAERARRQANDYNAQLLGFAPQLSQYYFDDPLGGPQRLVMDDLIGEIEMDRYFVILQAYDFKKLVENKEKDILWITRFSMRAKGRKFDEELENMARAASQFFGTETKRLKRGLLPGEIKMGELEVVETMEAEEN